MTETPHPVDIEALPHEGKPEWKPASGTIEDDLRSRLACIAEATYWDRPYDERIAAIRGMCDLTTNGMTPAPTGPEEGR